MYEKIFQKFKDGLIDRRFSIKLFIVLGILTVVYVVYLFSLIFLIRVHWWLEIIGIVLFLLICLLALCTLSFIALKRELQSSKVNFLKFVKNIKTYIKLQANDVSILLPILKEEKIDKRRKVLEAVRHFQLLLSIKYKHGFNIASIISLSLTVTLPIVSMALNDIGSIAVYIVFSIVIISYVALVCIAFKLFLHQICDDLSEYRVLVRIESALSEIWMKELINNHDDKSRIITLDAIKACSACAYCANYKSLFDRMKFK